MRINILTSSNGYVLIRERDGGLDPFELFFDDYTNLESFVLKLLEHEACITEGK